MHPREPLFLTSWYWLLKPKLPRSNLFVNIFNTSGLEELDNFIVSPLYFHCHGQDGHSWCFHKYDSYENVKINRETAIRVRTRKK